MHRVDEETRSNASCSHSTASVTKQYNLVYQRKLGSKQAYRVVHQPVSRGLAVFADAWLSSWLAEISANLRENGSASEVVLHDDALYKSTTFTLLYNASCRLSDGGLLNPLIATLKPHRNRPSHSNTVIGTLAVDRWAVTYGTARRGLNGAAARQAPPRCTKCNSPPINGQCTNFVLFDVAL